MPIVAYAKGLSTKVAEKRLRAMADSAAVPGNSAADTSAANSGGESEDADLVSCRCCSCQSANPLFNLLICLEPN
jgi:hypothetical protein